MVQIFLREFHIPSEKHFEISVLRAKKISYATHKFN